MASCAGWVLLAVGAILAAVGVATWPPGGLFFALPYLFLIPAVPAVAIGALLLLLGSRKAPAKPPPDA